MTKNKGVRADGYEGLVRFGRIVSTIGHIGFRGPIGPMPMQRVGVECAAGKLPPRGKLHPRRKPDRTENPIGLSGIW